MDWIHCNGCYVQPRSNSNPPKFFLTSCGHIFCERCNETASSNKCRVCEAEYTTTALSSQLREEVLDFFTDPATLLSKCVKVIQYQNNHRERLSAYHRRVIPKYESAKREIQRLLEENRNLRKKNLVQQQEIAWYKMQRDRQRAARAASAPSPPTPASLPRMSPFVRGSSSSDTQRAALQQMRNSGLGNSRISMGFTSSTPRSERSPLPMMAPATPFSGQYRSQHFVTPESTPGGNSSFLPDSPASDNYRPPPSGNSSSQRRQRSPPSRGTPTDALKILSLAYQNANHKP